MSTLGTFDAFTSARLGIYAAQQGFRVTGNNISNINTEGYTRQRLDQVSFKAGAYDRYRSQLDNHVGSGALVTSINQVRDPYLDVRYRNISADVGYHDTMLAGLQKIADILDEIGLGEDVSSNEKGDGLLHAQFQDLATKLRAFEKEPTALNDTLVRNSAETLCFLLNDYARQLDSFYQETVEDFNDQVTEVNECLRNIRDLNREIRDCEIFGDNALELRDERNRQIDKLSEYIHIKVVYTEEKIGGIQTVEKLSIFLDDDNPDPEVETDQSMLIDGVYGAQLYRTPVLNENFDPTMPPGVGNEPYLDEKGNPVLNLKDADLKDPENFGLTISKLVDVNDQEWVGRTTVYTPVDKNTQDTIDKLLKSTTAGADQDSGWKVVTPATNAVYSFDFTPSETEWKDDETFQIGDTTYTIGSGAGQVSTDVANDPAQMAAFIATELGKSEKYKDTYEVKAVTENGSTMIQFTSKKAGEIPTSDRPSLQVSSDPQNKLSMSTRKVITAGRDAEIEGPTSSKPDPDVPDRDIEVSKYAKINGVWNKVTTYIDYTKKVDLDDNDLHGSLQAVRELLTEAGEFTTQDTVDKIDENAAGKRGIPYYQYSLDLLAKQFADQYNQLNQGYMLNEKGNYVDKNGNELKMASVPDEPINAYGLTDAQKQALVGAGLVDKDGNPDISQWLKATIKNADGTENPNGAVPMGGVLFSTRNDNNETNGITAHNISVSLGWSTGDPKRETYLVPKFEVLFGGDLEHSTQNINAGHMVSMIEKGLRYDPTQIVPDAVSKNLFEGNFNDMFSNINSTRGKDSRHNETMLNTCYGSRMEVDYAREGVSGVDLNDEAMNLMQFQKAYSAACRLMTVVDEALDRLINNTGIAGR